MLEVLEVRVMLPPVIAGVDGSSESPAAAAWAAREVVRRELQLRLVHGWESPPGIRRVRPGRIRGRRSTGVWHVPYGHGIPDAEERGRVRQEAERELAVLLEPWREKFPGVCVRETGLEGRAAHAVAKAAGGACLLVVGRRGHRAAIGSRTGPAAHALIHHVTCPVAVVP